MRLNRRLPTRPPPSTRQSQPAGGRPAVSVHGRSATTSRRHPAPRVVGPTHRSSCREELLDQVVDRMGDVGADDFGRQVVVRRGVAVDDDRPRAGSTAIRHNSAAGSTNSEEPRATSSGVLETIATAPAHDVGVEVLPEHDGRQDERPAQQRQTCPKVDAPFGRTRSVGVGATEPPSGNRIACD
jgi:hypothetical protein